MNILPQIAQRIDEERKNKSSNNIKYINLDRQQIFEIFIKFYYNNELKRIVYDAEYKEIFKEIFGFEEEKDAYNDSYTKDVF